MFASPSGRTSPSTFALVQTDLARFLRFLIIALVLLCTLPSHGYTPKRLRAPQVQLSSPAFPPPSSQRCWIDPSGSQTPLHDASLRSIPVGPTHSHSISIFTYNVLGPLHGEGSKHDYAPVHVTKWTRRRDKLLQELRTLDADVLCLQEVSSKALRETFIPGLKQAGLVCAAFAPSRVGQESKGRFGHKNIGCAIFTRPSRVQTLSSKRVHLRDFAPLHGCASHELCVDVDGLWNPMALLHVAILPTHGGGGAGGQMEGQREGMEGREGSEGRDVSGVGGGDGVVEREGEGGEDGEGEGEGEGEGDDYGSEEQADSAAPAPPPLALPAAQLRHTLIIANTHLYWNPARADIKAVQTAAAARAISVFARGCGFLNIGAPLGSATTTTATAAAATSSVAPPIVLCGDFNCMPELPFDPQQPQATSLSTSSLSASLSASASALASGGDDDETYDRHSGAGEREAAEKEEDLQRREREREEEAQFAFAVSAGLELDRMAAGEPMEPATCSSSSSGQSESGAFSSPLSAPFVLLHEGSLPASHPEHPDRWCTSLRIRDSRASGFRSTQSDKDQASYSPYPNPRLGPLKIDFTLQNAYLRPEFAAAAPLFTTKTDEFQGWIDHVFASEAVQVQHVLLPPIQRGDLQANQQARQHGLMPSKDHPSDHLPLGVVCCVLG